MRRVGGWAVDKGRQGARGEAGEWERELVYSARVVIADCVEWGPGALSNGTERELRCPTRPAVQPADAGLSITKIYTVSFVGQARLYLRIVEEFGCEGQRFRRIAMRYGVKSNKISLKMNSGKTGSIMRTRESCGKVSVCFALAYIWDMFRSSRCRTFLYYIL